LLSLLACSESKDTDTAADTGAAEADTDTDTDLSQTPGDADLPYGDCLMLIEHDNDGDGTADFFLYYQFDSLGLISSYNGSTPSFDYEYTYDDAGLMASYTLDLGVDGIDSETIYTRDDDGDIVHIDVDSDGSGDIDQVIDWMYDGDKRLLREEVDDGIDGSIDELSTHVWVDNGDGTVTDERSTDVGSDTELDAVTHTLFDEEGETLSMWNDLDADTIWGTHLSYGYDTSGKLDVFVYEFLTNDGASVSTAYTWAYTRDEWGRVDYIDLHTLTPDSTSVRFGSTPTSASDQRRLTGCRSTVLSFSGATFRGALR
jgi:hypothetical protein